MKTFKGLVAPLVVAVSVAGGHCAHGLTFFVTQTNDSIEEASLGTPVIKKIKVRGGIITVTNVITHGIILEPSLRGAIIAANQRGGFNTILLQPKTLVLPRLCGQGLCKCVS